LVGWMVVSSAVERVAKMVALMVLTTAARRAYLWVVESVVW